MGKIKKLVKKVNPLAGKAMDLVDGKPKSGDSGPSAEDQARSAAEAAQLAATTEANRIAEVAAQNQRELANMNKNYAADLSTENRALVESAGTANDVASMDNPDQKRRRATTGLASTLGITV